MEYMVAEIVAVQTPSPGDHGHGVQSRWEVGLWDMCTFHSSSTLVRH